MSKEKTVQWILDHLFEDSDASNPDVHDLFMMMDDSEIIEFVRVAELYDADLLLASDLDAITMILEKYDQGPKLIGFCCDDEDPEEGIWMN